MNVAFIPARGGSKSIPKKNIKPIAGKPLIYWAVKAACECKDIHKVYVCTDDDEIASTARQFAFLKVEIIGRSEESASDTASTESAMLEFAQKHNFNNIVLIQATSPLVTSEDLEKGFAIYSRKGVDSILSVARQYRFVWKDTADGFAEPVNYDYKNRPRRQEFDGFSVENGAFYITGRDALLNSKCRLSGNIKTVEMHPDSYIELDEPDDWPIVEALLKKRELAYTLPAIKMFLTDCDGTLTDGGMYYSNLGEELKKFNTRDGAGLRMLKERGIITGIITGEISETVRRRAEKLNVNELIMGSDDKVADITELCAKYGIEMRDVAYIGDDTNDVDAMRAAALTGCPADASKNVMKLADFVSSKKGGDGAVREFVEWILESYKHP